jgi:type III secretion protein L
MLCRCTIELPKGAPRASRILIPRDELLNWDQADQLLSRADAQANELIRQAEKKCEVLLETASLEVWQRADAQFKQWAHERQMMCESLERYATSLTNQAIRCLLDEAVPPQRLSALIKQLLASQVQEVDATLLCHPDEYEEMKQCLAKYKATFWKLQPDETIPTQTIVLHTDEGDFRISWRSMLDTFFNPGKELRMQI